MLKYVRLTKRPCPTCTGFQKYHQIVLLDKHFYICPEMFWPSDKYNILGDPCSIVYLDLNSLYLVDHLIDRKISVALVWSVSIVSSEVRVDSIIRRFLLVSRPLRPVQSLAVKMSPNPVVVGNCGTILKVIAWQVDLLSFVVS